MIDTVPITTTHFGEDAAGRFPCYPSLRHGEDGGSTMPFNGVTETPRRPLRAFVDLDGVLVDAVGGVLARHQSDADKRAVRWGNLATLIGQSDAALWGSLDRDFWALLDWTHEGRQLLDGVTRLFPSVAFLSTPTREAGCCDGKRDWVAREIPRLADKLILTRDKATIAAPDAVLIDDHDANILAWRAAGGLGVLVPRPWNTGIDRCDDAGNFDVASLLTTLAALR